eukprot:CAMPEP_0205823102 /NCGR_PEP_ID=MMETSP0206-20130828/15060_1 /ASSEMBLY_ACC=CAM_ASM_000279 /TAXON_ID=36767 /ORGANISM="Euplotes focardii, Strain TN1" /LENGTH=157 /DNA_ID=CAMNT_0053119967 /DNA_START=132 /DNA_END=605 /DNA_ORIENTATION=+
MEIGLDVKYEPKLAVSTKPGSKSTKNTTKPPSKDAPMEENKEGDDGDVSDLFNSKSSVEQKKPEENEGGIGNFNFDNPFGEPQEEAFKVEEKELEINDDKIRPEIENAVESIADDVLSLTKNLHTIVDKLNSRERIYHSVNSDAVAPRIKNEDVTKL